MPTRGSGDTGEDRWLTDRRARLLRYGVGYALLTVAPFVALAVVAPAYGVVGLGAIGMIAGLYLGIFGEDMRAESVRASAYVGPNDPEYHDNPDRMVGSRASMAYAMGVAGMAFVAFLAIGQHMFG